MEDGPNFCGRLKTSELYEHSFNDEIFYNLSTLSLQIDIHILFINMVQISVSIKKKDGYFSNFPCRFINLILFPI